MSDTDAFAVGGVQTELSVLIAEYRRLQTRACDLMDEAEKRIKDLNLPDPRVGIGAIILADGTRVTVCAFN